jgi:hypothetical protein
MPTDINLFVSAIAMALGVFVTASPAVAAEIWSSERLQRLAPQKRAAFVRWYRVLGILLCLGAALFAFDSIWAVGTPAPVAPELCCSDSARI